MIDLEAFAEKANRLNLFYLASPYSASDPLQMHLRHEKTAYVLAQLLRSGLNVFSPIVHCHDIANDWNMPKDFEFWWAFDKTMLDHCDAVIALKLEGFKFSKGVKRELDYAEEQRMPVSYAFLSNISTIHFE